MNHYRLDLAWYFSAPGLAWDAALKLQSFNSNYKATQTVLMIESGIRGVTVMLKPTTYIWELSSITLRNPNSSRI